MTDTADSSGSSPADAARDAVVARLTERAGVGRLTLAEFDERARMAYAASSREELTAVTADLAAPTREPPARRPARRWAVALFGGSTIAGRWRLGGALRSVSLAGGSALDLRGVELDGAEVTITTVALFGGDDIFVPDSVDVTVTGMALFGGNDEHGPPGAERPGAPVVRIRAFALFGGVDVYRVPAEAMPSSLDQIKELGRRR